MCYSGNKNTLSHAAGPVLTIRVHSPTEGVIGVRIDHVLAVRPKLEIPLFPNDTRVLNAKLSKKDDKHVLQSGDLSAEITENPYTITFRSPTRILTEAGPKHQAVFEVPSKWAALSASNSSCLAEDLTSNPNPVPLPPTIRYVNSELNISPGELIYGLGEQFGSFVKNGTYLNMTDRSRPDDISGQSVKVWNQDGGTSSEQVYKAVPFYITNRGYGVFINHPGEVEVEVGSEKVSRVGVSVADASLEYFVIYGENPLQVRFYFNLICYH